jgi:hypothetical protein
MPSKEKYDVVGQKDKNSKDSPASSSTSENGGGDEVKLQQKIGLVNGVTVIVRSLATWFRCLFMNEMFPR